MAAASLAAASLAIATMAGCRVGRTGEGRISARSGGAAGETAAGPVTEAAARTATGVPDPGGRGSIAAQPPAGSAPTRRPEQAADALAGQAVPTNQWWTSALTGPLSQAVWAKPLAVRVTADGLQVSSAAPVASQNSVITPFVPAAVAGGPVTGLRVTGYGAFHAVLRADLRGGGSVEATLVQGSPVLYLRFSGTRPALTMPGATPAGAAAGTGEAAAALEVTAAAGQRWDLLSDGGGWQRDGDRFTATGAASGRVALARVPDGADPGAWRSAMAGAAADPVTDTTAAMAYDRQAGAVVQTLTAKHRSGRPGVWALLPHQQAGFVPAGTTPLAGGYQDVLGPLTLVRAKAVRVRVPLPGLLTAAPKVPLDEAARAAVTADLDADLAAPPGAGGSYFGLKELGRLATIAEVAQGVGATEQRRQALDRLRQQLVDWLTYGGATDGRYFAYDRTWGGLVAVPAEFGSNDYNDHHFQYGYLVRAAAVLAAADPAFARDYGGVVDLVVADYAGTLTGSTGNAGRPGFPPLRVFNAYLGHSAASGFAPFADGNNQESSSEAVAAWEAVVRWGLVTDRPDLVSTGAAHYALEAATARRYWLGQGQPRPAGYGHTVAGIVWDAKIDYATFFDPQPESVEGIQLLPLTFGSLYRADPAAAADRASKLAERLGGPPRRWGDLFAADLAAGDPAVALGRLGPALPREDSTSRAMVRYYTAMLAAFGAPQPAVTADAPFAMAFGAADHPTLVVANPTGRSQRVTFRADGRDLATITVEPGEAVTRAP